MKGKIVKRKIRKGKIARKNENEMAAARLLTNPSDNPLAKNRLTSYKGTPSNPGNMIFCEALVSQTKGFEVVNFSRRSFIKAFFRSAW